MTNRERRIDPDLEGPDQQLDEAADESFPASDPPAWEPTHAGTPVPPATPRTATEGGRTEGGQPGS